jgi:dienelactone hydrolase
MSINFVTALAAISVLFLALGTAAEAAIVTKPVPYISEGFDLEGYLAYDDAVGGKRPGVLVIHEWWGLNDAVRKRVDQLAAMGYVAFALDLYGKGKTTTDLKKATHMLRMVQMNLYRWHQRALAGLEVLRGLPQVDRQRIAAIGYGWGGVTLQQQLSKGIDIKGAVMFDSFIAQPSIRQQAADTKLLVLIGAANPYVEVADLSNYLADKAQSDRRNWQMVMYGGAKHGFSDPSADRYGLTAFEYNANADRQSWHQVDLFLKEVFRNS